jgi:hypothetical protein
VETVPNYNRKIIDTPNTQIHDRSHSGLGADTSIKSSGVNLVLNTKKVLVNTHQLQRVNSTKLMNHRTDKDSFFQTF